MNEDKNEEKELEKNDPEDELEIEVVSGTGEELNISPVYDHIKLDKITNVNKDKEIVIPKVKKEDNNNENTENKKEN